MSNQEDIAIKVEGVYKDFDLPHESQNSLKSRLLHPMSKGKNVEKQHALKDISFEIKKGEFFGIVGRNGSGKSTLLKILAEIYTPTKGKVTVNGSLTPFIELGVGFNPELTGRENVYLNGAMLGFNTKEMEMMYDEIVDFAELEKFMDQKLKNYSSGMQVRLAFSVAIRAKSDILLLDEVLAVGDADFKRKCFDYFKQLKKNEKTVVLVSHDMNSIKEYCDKALLIEKSAVKSIGKTDKIADQYSEMFLTDKNRESTLNKPNLDKRSGSGAVVISDIALNKPVITSADQYIELFVSLKANHNNRDLMTGFAVKNSEGLFINSSHSWDKRKSLVDLRPGERCLAKWTIPNIYEDGLYTIDIYTLGRDSEEYDKIEEAINFRSKRINKSGSLITIPISLNVELDGKK